MNNLQSRIKELEKEIEIKNGMIHFTEKKNNIEVNKKNPNSKFIKFYNHEIEKYQKEICEIYNELYKLWEEENKQFNNEIQLFKNSKSKKPLLQEQILNINNEENLLNTNNHSNHNHCIIL